MLGKLLVFDEENALGRLGGDRQLLCAIIEVFLEDTPRQLAILSEALNNRDFILLGRIAHSLKSASMSVGGMVLSENSRCLEQLAKDMNFEICGKVLKELFQNYSSLVVSLESVLEQS